MGGTGDNLVKMQNYEKLGSRRRGSVETFSTKLFCLLSFKGVLNGSLIIQLAKHCFGFEKL